SYKQHRNIHSFPTRRSSDLKVTKEMVPHYALGIGKKFKNAYNKTKGGIKKGAKATASGVKKGAKWSKDKVMDGFDWAKGKAKDGDRKSTRLNSSHVSISYAV